MTAHNSAFMGIDLGRDAVPERPLFAFSSSAGNSRPDSTNFSAAITSCTRLPQGRHGGDAQLFRTTFHQE